MLWELRKDAKSGRPAKIPSRARGAANGRHAEPNIPIPKGVLLMIVFAKDQWKLGLVWNECCGSR